MHKKLSTGRGLATVFLFVVMIQAAGCAKRRADSKDVTQVTPTTPAARAGRSGVKTDQGLVKLMVRKAFLTMEVVQLELAREKVESLAQSHGGYVHAAHYHGRGSSRKFEITLKVPQTSLMQVLKELRQLGTAIEERMETKEVTDAVLDLEARLKNLRTTENRLQQIALNHTSDVKSLLAVEEHATRVRNQIEQMEALKRHYSNAVSLSTVQITLLPKEGRKKATAPLTRIGKAFKSGFLLVKDMIVGITVVFGRSWLVLALLALLLVAGIRLFVLLRPILSRWAGLLDGGSVQKPTDQPDDQQTKDPTQKPPSGS